MTSVTVVKAVGEGQGEPFADSMGRILPKWLNRVVVLVSEDAPTHTVVFDHGTSRFFDGDQPFTPRVEEWADTWVEVL